MLLPIVAGLVVSVDALFIGISLGLQKKCKFVYLALINVFLLGLCMGGFFVAGQIYERIPFDPDLVVGLTFIALGLWTILQYVVFGYIRRRKGTVGEVDAAPQMFVIAGLVMSMEAMLITMGITFLFFSYATFAIPVTVALAHFGYSALTFRLARVKQVQRIPLAVSHAVSGFALILYGMLALFVDFGMVL